MFSASLILWTCFQALFGASSIPCRKFQWPYPHNFKAEEIPVTLSTQLQAEEIPVTLPTQLQAEAATKAAPTRPTYVRSV